MTEHEQYVVETLAAIRADVAVLTERTATLPELQRRIRSLELRAAGAGAVVSGAIIAVREWIARHA